MSSVRFNFADRHIGPDGPQIKAMLGALGEEELSDFISKVVPVNISLTQKIATALPLAVSETAAISELRELANQNIVLKSLIGMGYFGTITPPVILRNVLENPAWYTAYTPYQPEISQGRLEAIFAFQTVVTDLTGLDVSNASMLDEATAAAESMTLARRVWQGDEQAVFIVDKGLHPQIKAVIATRARPLKISIIETEPNLLRIAEIEEPIFGAIFAQIASNGEVRNLKPLVAAIQERSALAIIACDLLALTIYKTPAEFGADIAIGSAQRFGVPMGFGGPHAGFMAVRNGLERSLPGRLVGQSLDSHSNPALRLALQTREQHIRRDKATSNICTAQVLLAVMSAFYAMWHGPRGLAEIAISVRTKSNSLRDSLREGGFKVTEGEIFDTFSLMKVDAKAVMGELLAAGFNVRMIDSETLGFTFDESITDEDLLLLVATLETKLPKGGVSEVSKTVARDTKFLQHPLFNTYHSETSMLRYLRSLADRDLALDRTMIPLGSCTMKLNATTEMIPVTWPEFSNLHPFAPADQSKGIRKLIDQLSGWLIEITGYDAVSLQPNAGSQGEFAGLLA
ncbi:MAG: glycine dehydrogenase (aminomethyl-transferring), partial [Actinomycetes bacterium]